MRFTPLAIVYITVLAIVTFPFRLVRRLVR